MRYFWILILLTGISFIYSAETPEENKEIELTKLEEKIKTAKEIIRSQGNIKASDFLQLLPSVSLSKRTEYQEPRKGEVYLGASINISQIFSINDRHTEREVNKEKMLRRVDSIYFEVKKLIDRKYLLKTRVWKFTKIKSSMSNPVDIAAMDEKIDESLIKIQEIEIDIEKAYSEIDYIVTDSGR